MEKANNTNLNFLLGGGEMGRLTREKDWNKTTLGSPQFWSQSLRTTLGIILNSKFPMFLFWGEELTCFYNDAYRPSLGKDGKHPSILGMKGADAWQEIWHIIKPLIDQVLAGGDGIWREDELIPIYRNGLMEDVYWTFSYSPVNDESGKPAGVFVACTETTEKVFTQKKLVKSANELQNLFENAPFSLMVLEGEDLVITLANKLTKAITQRPDEEFVGKRLHEIVPEAIEQGFDVLLKNVMETGITFNASEVPVNFTFDGKSGTHYLDYSYQPFNEMGKPKGIVSIAIDVTEKVLARQKIEKSEEKYRSIFESIDEGFCVHELILDENNKITDLLFREVNEAFEKHTGVKNAKGKRVRELFPQVEQHWLDSFTIVYKTGEPVRVEGYQADAQRWLTTQYSRIGGEGSRLIAAVFNDITERKQQEQKQGYLLELSDELKTITDPHEIQSTAVTQLGKYLKSARAGYAEDGGDGDTIVITRNYIDGTPSIEGTYQYNDYGPELVKELRAGRIVVRNDIANDASLVSAEKEAHALLQLGAMVNVPLVKNRQLVAILFVHFTKAHHFSEQELALIEETAERTWAAVVRARAEDALRHSQQTLHSFVTTSSSVVFNMSADWQTLNMMDGQGFLTSRENASTWLNDFIPDFERSKVSTAFKKAIQQKVMYELEHQIIDITGELAWVDVRAVPIFDEGKNIVEWIGAASNITPRKNAEEALRKTKEQLELSISAGTIGIWTLDVKNNSLYWSKQQCELYGLSENEFEGTTEAFWKFVLLEDQERLKKESAQHFVDKKTELVQQFRITRKDGKQRWVESRNRTQFDELDMPAYITGINLDITAEKSFAQELENKVIERTLEINRQKAFTETILNSTPDLIAVYDLDTRLLALNKASEDLFNIKKEDIIGKIYTDVFPFAKGGQGEKDLMRAFNGESVHNEVYFSAVTGRSYENFILPLRDETDKIYAAVAIAHDITESLKTTELIRQSEEKFNKLFSASPLALTLSEIQSGQVVDVNEVYVEITGYDKSESIGKNSINLNLINSKSRKKILAEILKNGFVKNLEVEITHKNGRIIPVLLSTETIQIGDKEYFLSAIINITERKNAEQKIIESAEKLGEKNLELERINKELESFNYIASHDLQEPLRKITTFINLIEMNKFEKELTEKYFYKINDSAIRMSKLIQSILDFSRISKTKVRLINIDLNKVLADVEDDFEILIQEKGATIKSMPLPVLKANALQMHQVFANLISNSIKFSTKKPEIIIEAKEVSHKDIAVGASQFKSNAEQKFIQLTFSDNGIGFASGFKDKIFEVFQRLHGQSEYSGTGIGLSIVKKIVEAHNGFISVESVEGTGTVFTITLPKTS